MQKDEKENEKEDESEEQAGLLTKIVKCCEAKIREANLGSKATISKGCIEFEFITQMCWWFF